MSFYDSASLAFLPSGGAGKDGKAYSIKPTDGSGDFTFSRGSNLTATRVDSNGLIEKGRENLLLKSNLFDNGGVPPSSWSTSNASVSSGQSGYDGSSDAWLLSKSAASGRIWQSTTSVSGVQTFSAYVKANASTWALLQCIGGSNPYAYFDLGTGVVGSIGGGTISNSIEDVGGGWYRISFIHNTTISSARIYPAEANTASGTSGSIYIQDAQLEIGLVATEYIESGATTGKAGLLEDSPRFDYSGGASCPSLLLEPSRTNLVPYSEYFEGSGWLNSGITFDANNTISPQGLQNAYKITTAISHSLFFNTSVSVSTDYTLSFYAKRGTMTNMKYAIYDVTNGNFIIPTTSYYSSTSADEWTRISATFTTPSNCVSARIFPIYNSGSSGDVYLFGAQLEQGSYISSYIPNHSGGSVTRNVDNPAQLDVTNLTSTYNTLFVEFEVSNITNQGKIALSDNSQNNRMTIYQTTDDLMLLLNVGGSGQTSITASNVLSVGTNFKVIAKHQNGSHALFINGTKIGEQTSTTPTGLNKLRYGNEIDTNDSQKFLGNIKQTLVFPKALSNTDCEIITGTSYESFAAMATALNYTTYE